MSVQLVFWLKICLFTKQYQCVSQKNHAIHCYIDYIRDKKNLWITWIGTGSKYNIVTTC